MRREGLEITGIKGHEKRRQESHVNSIEAIRERNKKLVEMADELAKYLPELDPIHPTAAQTRQCLGNRQQ